MPPVAPTHKMSEGGRIQSGGNKVVTWVYLLQSIPFPRQRYIGLAENVEMRLQAHNRGASPHSSTFKPWKVVLAIRFENREKAAAFDRYLKSGSGFSFAKRHFW